MAPWRAGVSASLAAVSLAMAQQVPNFRARADLVLIDVTAVSPTGIPVNDLRRDEIRLEVDGKERVIDTFELVRVDKRAVDDITRRREPALPLPYGSNLGVDAGRTIVIAFQHESIKPGNEMPTKAALEKFLDRLGASDRVGLLTFPLGRVEVDLTTNRERVRSALTFVIARNRNDAALLPMPTVSGECSGTDSLVDILSGMKGIAGPKTLVLVAGSLQTRQECLTDVTKTASQVDARFYIIRPLDFGISASQRTPTAPAGYNFDGGILADLAIATGGEFFAPAGTVDGIFTRIEDETSAYYLLGFEPLATEQDRKTHRVSLMSTREHVVLRHRSAFSSPPPEINSKTGAAPVAQTLLGDYGTHTELGLRTAAYAFKSAHEPFVKVVTLVEPAGDTDALTNVAFGLYDAKGRVAARWNADSKELASRPIASATEVAEGFYRLRAAAQGSTGLLGSADFEFDARLHQAGDMRFSDVMLGTMTGKEFQPHFVLASEPEVACYFEGYGSLPGVNVPKVSLELAASATATPIATASARFSQAAPKWIVVGGLPIRNLPSGDYLVRAVISHKNKVLLTLTRTLRKATH